MTTEELTFQMMYDNRCLQRALAERNIMYNPLPVDDLLRIAEEEIEKNPELKWIRSIRP